MKQKTVFVCSECGTESLKWMGKCPGCGAWNTMNEETVVPVQKGNSQAAGIASSGKPKPLKDISTAEEMRISTGMGELDRVLGGGIVPGSLVLIGGDPGIGKSTILLQCCETLGKEHKILYVSGEESQRQIKLRADRLGVQAENLRIYSETNISNVIACIYQEKPDILIKFLKISIHFHFPFTTVPPIMLSPPVARPRRRVSIPPAEGRRRRFRNTGCPAIAKFPGHFRNG